MLIPNARVASIIWCALVALLLGNVFLFDLNESGDIDSNILSLLPASENIPALQPAIDSYSESTMRELIFLVKNESLEIAKENADQLGIGLAQNDWVEQISVRVSQEQQRAIGEYVYSNRHFLMSEKDQVLLENEEYEYFVEDSP